MLALREEQLLGRVGLWAAEHLIHGADLRDAAVADDGHAVADLFDDAHLMRDDQHRDAERPVQIFDEGEDGLRGRGVERAGRLVAQQHLRIRRKRARNGDALLLPAGKLRRIGAGAVGKADDPEQLPRARLCLAAGRA